MAWLECGSHATVGAIEMWLSCAAPWGEGFICAKDAAKGQVMIGSMALEQPESGLTYMLSVARSAYRMPRVRSAT